MTGGNRVPKTGEGFWQFSIKANYPVANEVREQAWKDIFGFLYSRDETVDEVRSSIFAAAYWLARGLGSPRLSHPLEML
jgi:hypothetical protein